MKFSIIFTVCLILISQTIALEYRSTDDKCESLVTERNPIDAIKSENPWAPTKKLLRTSSLKAYECTAKKYCKDPQSPSGHIWHCYNKLDIVNLDMTDGNTIKILVPTGCRCRLEKEKV